MVAAEFKIIKFGDGFRWELRHDDLIPLGGKLSEGGHETLQACERPALRFLRSLPAGA